MYSEPQWDINIPENFEEIQENITFYIHCIINNDNLAISLGYVNAYLMLAKVIPSDFEIEELKSALYAIYKDNNRHHAEKTDAILMLARLWYYAKTNSSSIWIDTEYAFELAKVAIMFDRSIMVYVYFALSNYIFLDHEFVERIFAEGSEIFKSFIRYIRSYTEAIHLQAGLTFLNRLLQFENENFYMMMSEVIPILRAHIRHKNDRIRSLSLRCLHKLLEFPPTCEIAIGNGVQHQVMLYVKEVPLDFVPELFDVIFDFLNSPASEVFVNVEFVDSLILILERCATGDIPDVKIGMIFAILTKLEANYEELLTDLEKKNVFYLAIDIIMKMTSLYRISAAIFIAYGLDHCHIDVRQQLIDTSQVFEALASSIGFISNHDSAILILKVIYQIMQINPQKYIDLCDEYDVEDNLLEKQEDCDEETSNLIDTILYFMESNKET